MLQSQPSSAIRGTFLPDFDAAFETRVRLAANWLELSSDDLLLDTGCGRSEVRYILEKALGCKTFGIDRSERAIAYSRIGVRTVRGSVEQLPFRSESFKKAVCCEVLEHLDDDLNPLRELARVMQPGGRLFITVPNRSYPFLWDPVNRVREALGFSPIRKGLFSGIWTDHRRLYGIEELEALCEEAGFKVLRKEALIRFCFPFSHLLLYTLPSALAFRKQQPRAVSMTLAGFRAKPHRRGAELLLRKLMHLPTKLERIIHSNRSVHLAVLLER